MADVDFVALKSRFEQFSELECKGSSELYEHLAAVVAQDDGLLELSSRAQPRQPLPNMLFAAVHYLLLAGVNHPLREFYPSVVGEKAKKEPAATAFKQFCDLYHADISKLLQSRRVQTNEVRRCAYLYPTFCEIYRRFEKPLALFEIGTAAGLQLVWDLYSYSYDAGETTVGASRSSVLISSEMRGNQRPHIDSLPPPVAWRAGADIRVADLTNNDEESRQAIAKTDGHARWFEWLVRTE